MTRSQQCDMCLKFAWPTSHSCNRVPVGEWDQTAKHFHPYPDDPEPKDFTNDEWLMLIHDLHPTTPIGIIRHYVALRRKLS